MRPYDAKGENSNLPNDNHEVGDFWILTDGFHVTIREQMTGESPTQGVSIPRTEFNRLIDWYMREQQKRMSA